MAESLHLPDTQDRSAIHAALLPQVKALLHGETDAIAAMAELAAAIKQAFQFHWVGFYRVMGEELVLGPFQGPIACSRIARGRGVCGTAWVEDRTIVVPDVDRFAGHIACSAQSRSELVVPLHDANGHVRAVLDVDSSVFHDLGPLDAMLFEDLGRLIEPLL
ncbi:MAG: GAF domain-containing protein [Flavobacteriales bacterium]|nr:GAF domain-containing protein [Flavobacteriales bacterium]MCB9193455.1 GAF domain-containing protein [Flavobacteriales bacterium]